MQYKTPSDTFPPVGPASKIDPALHDFDKAVKHRHREQASALVNGQLCPKPQQWIKYRITFLTRSRLGWSNTVVVLRMPIRRAVEKSFRSEMELYTLGNI